MRDDVWLADILERIDRIDRAVSGGKASFLESEVIQDAVIRNLEVIGEAAKRVSPATRRANSAVPWKEASGFRDLAIHQYGAIDLEAVWDIVTNDLPRIRRLLASSR